MDKIPPLVFHADWFDIIEDLPQEQQLEIYRAIMLYAFRGEKSSNPLVRGTIALMVKFIDQDRVKYEKAIKQRKEAIRKRWEKHKKANTDEYDRINPNTTEYNTITNTNTSPTKVVDVDNINSSRPCASAVAAVNLRNKIAELKDSELWLEQMAMKFHATTDEVRQQLDTFCEDMELRGRLVTNPQSLFVTWLSGKKYGAKPKAEGTEPGLGIGEYRNSKGERTYGTSGIIVPESAPPRPSAAHWWSKTSERWEKMI